MFSLGMSRLDYRSMIRGQQKVKELNEERRADFELRFSSAIQEQINNPDPSITSVKKFCKRYGFSNRTFFKPAHENKLKQIQNLQHIRRRGRPVYERHS